MATIYAIVSTKGGCGKSTVSFHVLSAIFTHLGRNFKIFEIDNNNDSNIYSQSDIIKNNTRNAKTTDQNIAAEIIYETLSSDNEIIIDAGGGDDALKVIEIVKSLGKVDVKWLIPINQNLAQLKNATDTYKRINDPQNTFFILNGYRDLSNLRDEFVFYFGDANMNIQSIRDQLEIKQEFKIPFSNFFEISEMQNYTIGDLARISQELPKEKATAFFYDKFSDDRNAFFKAWNNYRNSELAGDVLKQIFTDFLPFFTENTPIEQKSTKVK